MKYRKLSKEELQGLEKEFIKFLIANGIAADDWKRIMDEEKANAEKIIEQFSDVIFEGIFRSVAFLESRDKTHLTIFQCLERSMMSVTLDMSDVAGADLTDQNYIEKVTHDPPPGMKVFSAEKEYKSIREEELFEMTENGCVITDDRLFKVLCLAL